MEAPFTKIKLHEFMPQTKVFIVFDTSPSGCRLHGQD